MKKILIPILILISIGCSSDRTMTQDLKNIKKERINNASAINFTKNIYIEGKK